MVREFISGWDLMQILGEGTFAEVKLLVNRDTGEACAMKEIDLSKHPDAKEAVKKEICVHKLLCHPNIVRCYGSRVEESRQFIFLEYCAGGELFDRIEPENGMPEHCAQNFFRQIIDGVGYLHERGIAHRDIKPENLLLSDSETLKISDFGMATVFRHKGKERLLERRCGTLPYIAPEVLMKPQYQAEPADIWSCGMVLLAMITGELPWDRPTPDQPHYITWRDNECQKGLWTRIESLPLSLLRKILNPTTSKRCSIAYIKSHLWYKKKFKDSEGHLLEPELVSPPLKRCFPGGDFNCLSQPQDLFEKATAQFKHPAAHNPNILLSSPNFETKDVIDGGGGREIKSEDSEELSEKKKDAKARERLFEFGGFSQPAMMTNYYTGTQQSTQTQTNQSIYQRLVKRMTRFWVDLNFEKTDVYMTAMLKKLGYKVGSITKGLYTIETTDRRGTVLLFKCTFIRVEGKILVDFRLSRGCGLEFKRHFAKIKLNCREVLDKAPILWPALIPIDAMPEMPD